MNGNMGIGRGQVGFALTFLPHPHPPGFSLDFEIKKKKYFF